MSKIIDKLQNASSISEWIDPWDVRLEIATGQPAPQKGGVDRIGWEVEVDEWPLLVSAVKRLIVPEEIATHVTAEINGDVDWNRVVLTAQSGQDWEQCFPANDRTNIMTEHDLKRWAAVAITDTELGFAVFAEQKSGHAVIARVQSIPEETVRGILGQ